MEYKNVVEATFISRPNRFIAKVDLNGVQEVVHVKNTGRCGELLVSGKRVYLNKSNSPNRKTAYDLIAVDMGEMGIVNIDSSAPNVVVKEYLHSLGFSEIKPEYKYGDSRLDFFYVKDGLKSLMEVKGCTLREGSVGLFPDAPTQRGARHLRELRKALEEGYDAAVAFVIQMEGVDEVIPNEKTDPEFASAFREAVLAGVKVVFFYCRVEKNRITIIGERGLF